MCVAGEKVLMFFFPPKNSEMRLGRWCAGKNRFYRAVGEKKSAKNVVKNYKSVCVGVMARREKGPTDASLQKDSNVG